MSALSRLIEALASLIKNKYFWGGIGVLFALALLVYVVFNSFVMPAYTRQNSSLRVPNVENMPAPEAQRVLEEAGLRAELIVQRYNPALPPDVVVDQNPPKDAMVKPNRSIFLTVNSGVVPMVKVPRLDGMSLREAINRLKAVGLDVGLTQPDTIPSPYANTITRQRPWAGDSLKEGGTVDLWYSTGLGSMYVSVPDVTGKTVGQAQRELLEHLLRSVVVGGPETNVSDTTQVVVRQSRTPGSRVREGFEIRLFLDETTPLESEPAAPTDTEE